MTSTDDPANVLVVRRLVPVPREQVFAAWLDPASLAQWMCPGDVRGAIVEILTHRRLPPTQIDSHRRGWTEIMVKLDAILTIGQKPG
jgi:hypothetical protein